MPSRSRRTRSSTSCTSSGWTTRSRLGTEEVADLNAAEERLARIVSELFDGGATVHSVLRRGVPSERIVEFADEVDADLIVIGRHGGGDLRDHLLGSTPARVLTTTSRPTLLVSDTPE